MKNKADIINIKVTPVQYHIGSSKFSNEDWGTVAFVIPRNELQMKFADIELQYNCIYFLIGYESGIEKIYVGQAKKRNSGGSVLERLREHDKSNTEKYNSVWTWAVVVTSINDTWSLDDLNALEHTLYNEIPSEVNLNGNTPNSGGANFNAYKDKIRQIKSYLTSIGFQVFTEQEEAENIQVTSTTNEYSIVEDLQNGMARIPEIVTPHKVVKAMVDMLPSEVWNDSTVFLDPACKGGEYLKEIYDRLMETESLQAKYPNEIERAMHILKYQIYGIALSQVSLERTTKKLMGFGDNIRIIPNYIEKLKGKDLGSKPDGTQPSIRDILNEEFSRQMKFDVVIGNPPYQESTGAKARAIPIYQLFVNAGFTVSNIVCMITPARWFSASDNNSKEMRKNILNNGTSGIAYFEKSNTLFSGVNINGGVSYFCTNKGRHGKTDIIINGHQEASEDLIDDSIFIPSKMARSIVRKVSGKKYIENTFFSQNAFGIDTNYIGVTGEVRVRTSSGLSDYIEESCIPKGNDLIKRYKVITGSMNTTSIINNPEILEPYVICTRTYTVLGAYNTEIESNIVKKYFMTKFVRALIGATLNNQMVSYYNYRFVPLQDFTSNSDIDWSQSIADIDKQLYAKYNLTQDEIDYIESTIKPME